MLGKVDSNRGSFNLLLVRKTAYFYMLILSFQFNIDPFLPLVTFFQAIGMYEARNLTLLQRGLAFCSWFLESSISLCASGWPDGNNVTY